MAQSFELKLATAHEDDCELVLLPVLAQPRARKNALAGLHDGRLKVAVTQVPEDGKANEAIRKLLANVLELKKSQIQLKFGKTSRRKLFAISGISATELTNRIQALM